MKRPGSPGRASQEQACPEPNEWDILGDVSAALDRLISDKIDRIVEQRLDDIKRGNTDILIVNHYYGPTRLETNMARQEYKGNIGFVGPGAGSHASGTTFNTVQHQAFSEIDLRALAQELPRLRQAMMRQSLEDDDSDPDHAIAAAAIANAEKSAKAGDVPSTMGFLKSAGKWAWEIANKIGVSVAAKALEGAITQ
jgi:hypothetical protein